MYIVLMLDSSYSEEIVTDRAKFDTIRGYESYIRDLYESGYDLPIEGDSIEETIKYITENGEIKGEPDQRSLVLIDLTRID